MDLRQDYRAIRWMQENIPGSPVIVEANVPEVRWENRFTIYTGLPGMAGWNCHRRQRGSANFRQSMACSGSRYILMDRLQYTM